MFQVEVEVDPSEGQIEAFLDGYLREAEHWQDGELLSDDERGVFREVILALAERNPREVKRLVNSAMIAGTGTLMAGGRS